MSLNRPRRRGRAAILESLSPRILFASPLVITKGGTYSGTWDSQDPSVPAVSVRTSDPVIIENSTVSGRGDLIRADVQHTKITVRNTTGTGLNPNIAGKTEGHFFFARLFDNATIENNTLNGTTGIKVEAYSGDFSPGQTVHINRNDAKNIDGRRSDG